MPDAMIREMIPLFKSYGIKKAALFGSVAIKVEILESIDCFSSLLFFDIEQAIRLIANTETNNTTVKIFENFIIIPPLLFRFCLFCFQFLRFRLLFF